MAEELAPVLAGYAEFLQEIKDHIRAARVRAAVAVNRELVLLYWRIGREILVRQQEQGWGARVIERLAADLRTAFPEDRGFSARNLKYMRAFARAWPDDEIVQGVLAQLSWWQNIALVEKLATPEERRWYARQAVEHGWSRNVLVHQIEGGRFRRHGKALSNFDRTLPAAQSDLAKELLKDPYTFDFLTLSEAHHERDLERELTRHIRDFLLELGVGFAFVGSQHRLEVDGRDFYVDLLFYHLRLRCFVVIDLKVGEFEPEYAGKMHFYQTAIDRQVKDEGDRPTIGIILCRGRSDVVVEYALGSVAAPIGVSTYELRATLPEALRGVLPSADQLSAQVEAAIRAPGGRAPAAAMAPGEGEREAAGSLS